MAIIVDGCDKKDYDSLFPGKINDGINIRYFQKDNSEPKQEEVKIDPSSKIDMSFVDIRLSSIAENKESNSQKIFNLSSKVQLLCLRNLSSLMDSFFCGAAKKHGNHYVFEKWKVAIDDFYCEEVMDFIMPGGWVNTSTKIYSNDIILLHSLINGLFYDQSLMILNEYFENAEHLTKKAKKNWSQLWLQERIPLSRPKLNGKTFFYSLSNYYYYYYNKSGYPICINENLVLIGPQFLPERISRYLTIWKNTETHSCYWMPFFSQPPYMIFNTQLMNSCPTIVFVHDENEAIRNHSNHPECLNHDYTYNTVYSTCYGGLINLPDADFALLQGKSVIIQLEIIKHIALQIIPEAIKNLRKSGVSEIYISFLKTETEAITNVPFEDHGEYIHIGADDFLVWLNLYNGGRCDQEDSIKISTKSLAEKKDTSYDTKKESSIVSAKTPRIPRKIKDMAMVVFLRGKKISYGKIEKEYGIKHSHAHNIVKKNISKLSDKERKLFDIETKRLIEKNIPPLNDDID